MLKLVPNPTFKAPVKIRAPGGEEFTVTLEFKHRTKPQLDAFFASEDWKGRTDAQNVLDVAVGWSGVDAPFDEESLRTLFENYQGAPGLIINKYINELTAAKLGN